MDGFISVLRCNMFSLPNDPIHSFSPDVDDGCWEVERFGVFSVLIIHYFKLKSIPMFRELASPPGGDVVHHCFRRCYLKTIE